MKILLTCYYELKDALRLAAESLTKYNYRVVGYPLFKYYADVNDKNPNYVENFCDFVKYNKIDVILWWYFSIPTCDMEKIVNTNRNNNENIKNIMFNWDEPYNWADCDIVNKCKYFDTVFVTCAEKLDDYIKNGTNRAVLQYPGYDDKVHNIIINDEIEKQKLYTCDISICCTNLYDNEKLYPNQYIKRKKLIDDIYNNQKKYNYKFNIYGPNSLKDIYPDSYSGFVKYEDTNYVFNYSKINICTHVQYNTFKYLNERTITILGSGGLLLIDKVDGIEEILEPNKECIILDKYNYIEQIVHILKNYDEYILIRHNGYTKSKLYTWNEWAKNIVSELKNQ